MYMVLGELLILLYIDVHQVRSYNRSMPNTPVLLLNMAKYLVPGTRYKVSTCRIRRRTSHPPGKTVPIPNDASSESPPRALSDYVSSGDFFWPQHYSTWGEIDHGKLAQGGVIV